LEGGFLLVDDRNVEFVDIFFCELSPDSQEVNLNLLPIGYVGYLAVVVEKQLKGTVDGISLNLPIILGLPG
jgi:hypothetical protein